MSDYLSIISENLIAYIFGSPSLLGLFTIIVVSIVLFKMNLALDAMLMILFPMIMLFSAESVGFISSWMGALVVLLAGIIVGMMILKLWRRS